ncbi:hypothetical protein BHE97_17055 [Aeromicrobium sp. PE09-221]|uniref:hypothetical protein n=1 Tax=Aeromicrobium sp. PE09-221 TaxID=1898043 RepID=UPI000B3E5E19|nr:hypothetical protein [Aeromicrobium sp. PE09-221]OUZ07220.1 hypothetical protein BHE97_17055 [Aeromicrobium sp. PE09-221]
MTFHDSHARHRLFAVIIAGLAVLVLVGIGVYGLVIGPDSDSGTSDGERARPGSVTSEPGGPARSGAIPPIRPSEDPATFARVVATRLFDWDTASGNLPLDYTTVILDVGDPSGTEQPGLASDVASYLPTREAWIELREYATRQQLTIDQSYVPEAWDTAVEQAEPGQLAEGTIAYTIEGTRHRSGVWNDENVTSEHAVEFTVFIVCEPTYDSCRLLRLSELDNPLR